MTSNQPKKQQSQSHLKTIVTLTGPTCSGKTTLQKKLQDEGLSGIVSFTTRIMRQGEVEGKDYYFLSEDEYEQLSVNGIVEQIQLNGNRYGILKREIDRVLNLGKDIVVVVDPRGVRQISLFCITNNIRHLSIYVDNPEYVIYRRFLERFYADGHASLDSYALRLVNLKNEIKDWRVAYRYSTVLSAFGPENDGLVIHNILAELKDHD